MISISLLQLGVLRGDNSSVTKLCDEEYDNDSMLS